MKFHHTCVEPAPAEGAKKRPAGSPGGALLLFFCGLSAQRARMSAMRASTSLSFVAQLVQKRTMRRPSS